MPTAKPVKPRSKPEHRPMPEDPRELARAMFSYGDRQMAERRAAEKAAAQSQPVTPRQRTGSE